MSTETEQAATEPNTATVALERAPRNDAEAAQQEAARATAKPEGEAGVPDGDKKPEEAKPEKRNRTGEYINRINTENRSLRLEMEELRRQVQQAAPARQATGQPHSARYDADAEPDITNYQDFNEYMRDRDKWTRSQWEKQQKEAEATRKHHDTLATYEQRVASFAEQHPDFVEVVGSMDMSLVPQELQAAVLAHEMGPQIAYHLANDEDALFAIASIRPELMGAAVNRLASRLAAAPKPEAPAETAPPQPKPITQAPPPPPKLQGRAPATVPVEKMTDDDWYRADVERRRKR